MKTYDTRLETELKGAIDKNSKRVLPAASYYKYISEMQDLSFILGDGMKRFKNFIGIMRVISEVAFRKVFMKNFLLVFPHSTFRLEVRLRPREEVNDVSKGLEYSTKHSRLVKKKRRIENLLNYKPVFRILSYKNKIQNIFKFKPNVGLMSKLSNEFYFALENGEISYANYLREQSRGRSKKRR